MMAITRHVSQACNDKREVEPTIEAVEFLPKALGQVQSLIADDGYCSQANVQACRDAGIEPLLAIRQEVPPPARDAALRPDSSAPETADPVVQMAHRLGTQTGRALYKLRKQSVEPGGHGLEHQAHACAAGVCIPITPSMS